MAVAAVAVAILVGYLLGAIPSGVIVGRLRGVDPRSGGSGRTGATNALRTVGRVGAAAVLVLDVAKGMAAVLLAGWIASAVGGSETWSAMWAPAGAGIGAVAGHVRSVFIGFAGGRGVATGAGVMLILAPLTIVLAIPVLAIAIWQTRYVSLGSILAAITVALGATMLGVLGMVGAGAVVAASLIGVIVVVAHADNIERLRNGTERRLGSG